MLTLKTETTSQKRSRRMWVRCRETEELKEKRTVLYLDEKTGVHASTRTRVRACLRAYVVSSHGRRLQ